MKKHDNTTLNTVITNFLKKSADIAESVIPPDNALYTFFARLSLKLTAKARLQKRNALNLSVALVDHCNLNCARCDAFAPLVDDGAGSFLSVEEFEYDMKQLSRLMNNSIETLRLMGGEPLLHPCITEFCRIARDYFPIGEIIIITNAILLTKMPEVFWESCKENAIKISITKYPIKLDMNTIMDMIKHYNLDFEYWNGTKIKTMWKAPLDTSGSQNPQKSFSICFSANKCAMLIHGRIYPCPTSGYSFYMNQYFGCNFTIENADFVDIHQITDINVLYEFLCKPIPFCRYCNRSKIQFGIPWSISKKELSEWI